MYNQKQIKYILEKYGKLAHTIGMAEGIGSNIDDPSLGALEKLLEIKKEISTLPSEIKKLFPEYFNKLDEQINYCSKTEKTFEEVSKVLEKHFR